MANLSIASFQEILVALGLSDLTQLSTGNEALAKLVHGPAEGAVKDYIGYNPIQAVRTEFYPTRDELAGSMLHGHTEFGYATVSPLSHSTRAEIGNWRTDGLEAHKLLLRSIPIRSITSVHEDREGRSGQGSNKFPASTLLTPDEDYYIDLDENEHGRSGFLIRRGRSWPCDIRSVRVIYTAGYSPLEFMGFGDVDASPIKHAVILTAVRLFVQLKSHAGSPSGGFGAGPVKQEKLGDYAYAMGLSADEGGLGSFTLNPGQLPDAAKEMLGPYIHFGRTSFV